MDGISFNALWPNYGMVWYGAPPTPLDRNLATKWWQDRAPAEHAQTESVPSALVRRWVSFPQGQAPAVAELRACAISLCLEWPNYVCFDLNNGSAELEASIDASMKDPS
jgi:hypothetical protein